MRSIPLLALACILTTQAHAEDQSAGERHGASFRSAAGAVFGYLEDAAKAAVKGDEKKPDCFDTPNEEKTPECLEQWEARLNEELNLVKLWKARRKSDENERLQDGS